MCILSIVLSSSGTLLHGDCLIDIVSPLWEHLSRQRLFSHGNSEVIHLACVCILLVVLSISGTLLVIASPLWECLSRQPLFSHGNSEVIHSACVCILSVVLSISGTLLVIFSSTLFLRCESVCLIDDYSALGTVR